MRERGSGMQRVVGWKKRSPFNPYWLGWKYLTRAVEELAEHASGHLLDVGVAERPYSELFEQRVTRYTGLDYPPALEEKQPKLWNILDRLRSSVDVFGDAQFLPFQDACFDTLLSTEVLEHVSDTDVCVEEMARVLKPGGILLLTVPFCEPRHFLPRDYRRFTREGLELLLLDHGFEIVELEPRGNSTVALAATMVRWIQHNLVAKKIHPDGSVDPGSIRQMLSLPFVAVIQLLGHWLDGVFADPTFTLGYRAVARKR